MMHCIYLKGKSYRISSDGQVEVFVPGKAGYWNRWRKIKAGSRTFMAVHIKAKTPLNEIARATAEVCGWPK